MTLVADDAKHPSKPLSDAAASHSSERVASRDTSQSKKGDTQQTDPDSSANEHRSTLSNTAVNHRRVINIFLQLLLTAAAVLIAAQGSV